MPPPNDPDGPPQRRPLAGRPWRAIKEIEELGKQLELRRATCPPLGLLVLDWPKGLEPPDFMGGNWPDPARGWSMGATSPDVA